MPAGAPKNNKNAIGNKGGKEWSKENRDKATTLKGLVLDWATKIMESKKKDKVTEFRKREIVLKILPTCFPRPVEISGKEGEPIELTLTVDKESKEYKDFIKWRKSKRKKK